MIMSNLGDKTKYEFVIVIIGGNKAMVVTFTVVSLYRLVLNHNTFIKVLTSVDTFPESLVGTGSPGVSDDDWVSLGPKFSTVRN